MPYQRIRTAHIPDPTEREILERADLLLSDVYTMCCNHPLKRTKAGNCGFASALVLLSVLDALAEYVYPKATAGGSKHTRFVKLVVDKMQWGPESAGWTRQPDAAEILWRECRNPLAHAAGKDQASKFRRPGYTQPVAGPWGKIRVRSIARIDARKKWPEAWPILGPNSLVSSATGEPTSEKLAVVALYWAVKDVVRQLSK